MDASFLEEALFNYNVQVTLFDDIRLFQDIIKLFVSPLLLFAPGQVIIWHRLERNLCTHDFLSCKPVTWKTWNGQIKKTFWCLQLMSTKLSHTNYFTEIILRQTCNFFRTQTTLYFKKLMIQLSSLYSCVVSYSMFCFTKKKQQ